MGVVLAVALAVGLRHGRDDPSAAQRARDLSESIMCPACRGQSVADSDSSAARGIRTYIATRIDEGASDDQIRDELAASYGDEILLNPPRTGVGAVVWMLPVVVLVLGVAGIVFAFRRWSVRGAVHASEADRNLVQRSLAAPPPTGNMPEGR